MRLLRLRLRRERPELFDGYRPRPAAGPSADHVLAFDRGGAITVATRLPATLAAAGGWQDTSLELPPGRWVDVLAGDGTPYLADRVRLADLLADLPVALLVREED